MAFAHVPLVSGDCYCFQRAGLVLAGIAWSLSDEVTTTVTTTVVLATGLHYTYAD
jgi:hypothetical protein